MSDSPAGSSRSRLAWTILIAVLAIESVAGVLALVPLGMAFFAANDDALGQRVSVLLAALLAIVWVVVTFVGSLKSRASWARGSAMTMHVLMFAAGTGALQYALTPTGIAWALILAAFVGFFAALSARPHYHPEDPRYSAA